MKQTIATMKARLLRSTVLLALLFLVIPVAPRALGQETSDINGMAPHAVTAGSLMAPGPLSVGCPSTITQSLSQSIATSNSAACNLAGITAQNSYWRAFNMNTFTGGQAYAVTSVSFGIENAQSESRTGQPVTVNLYVNNGAAFPGGILTLLATSGSVNVPDQRADDIQRAFNHNRTCRDVRAGDGSELARWNT